MEINTTQTTTRFNRNDIQSALNTLRNLVRAGTVRVPLSLDATSLRREVASQFGIRSHEFNTEYFDERTLRRFADLFSTPWKLGDEFPTQDQVAVALQNFINRRKDVWSQYKATLTSTKREPVPMQAIND